MRSTFSSLIVGLVIILIIGFGGYYIITKLRANADVTGGTAATTSADINKDGTVNALDLNAITNAIAAKSTDKRYDLNSDGAVNVLDLNILIGQYSK
jgi:hypothetical protein